MRITIDPSRCVGHARCNARAPEVYDLDDDGYSVPLAGEIPADLEEQAFDGAEACPELALTIT